MSNLRIIGLIVGIFGLWLTFKVYRGPRWRRFNFILYGFFSLSLILISLNPNLLNTISGILALRHQQRGRIIFLLISSNIFLWFLLLYFKTKSDKYAYQFDLLVRNLGREDAQTLLEDKLKGKEIMVIIPAYNEADNLKSLLSRIPPQIGSRKVGVLVVDDGSTDNTAEVLAQEDCLFVRNKINRGQGSASRLGYDILLRHNVKIGVTMDADGQHLPEEIEKIIEPILQDEYDLVLGSRILGKKQKGSFLRDLGIHLFSKLISFLTGLKLTDCSSGFKAFNVDKIKSLNLREEQFQAAEVIIEAAKKGLRIGEIPVTILERNYGITKKGRDWKYGLGFLKAIFKSWWR